MKKPEVITPDTIEMINATKVILEQQIKFWQEISNQRVFDPKEVTQFQKLLSSLKDMSAQEREWEKMYGVSNWTEEKLKEEALAVLKKLGIEYIDHDEKKVGKEKLSWKLVDGVRVWSGTKGPKVQEKKNE